MRNLYNFEAIAILRRLYSEFVKPYSFKLKMAVFCMVISAALSAVNLKLIKPIIDDILVKHNITMLNIIPFALIALTLLKVVAEFYQNYLVKFVGQRVVTDLQMSLYHKLLYSDLNFVQAQSSGRLISRFTNDIIMMRGAASSFLMGIAKHFFTIIFIIIVMINEEPHLSLITLLVFSFVVYPVVRIGKRVRKLAHVTQDKLGDYTSKLDETFHSIRVIKSYSSEQKEYNIAQDITEGIFALFKKSARTDSLVSPIVEGISGVAIAFVIWYGGLMVINGETTAGSLFTLIASFFSVYKPFKSLAGLSTNLQEGIAAAKRLFIIFDQQEKVISKQNAQDLKITNGHILFKDIKLHYDNKLALNNINLDIAPQTTIALVGESGGGKTSLANLLVRFFDPSQGQILIDNNKISEVTLKSLRENIALVTQDVLLFDGTIFDNIAYGRENASKEEVIQAARDAAAYEFIMKMPEGFDTNIGSSGHKLSGGQRQRISIARAFLKNSPILILDEATSALDPIAEREIQNTLKKLAKGKTTLIIAHRLSTIENADKIYVLKEGQIIESGTHQELLNNSNEYAKLYKKQKN